MKFSYMLNDGRGKPVIECKMSYMYINMPFAFRGLKSAIPFGYCNQYNYIYYIYMHKTANLFASELLIDVHTLFYDVTH